MIYSTVMIHIEGVDTGKGLANCNGSEEAYLEVLESFLEDTHSKINELTFFDAALTRRWTASELSRFSFAVHAIKGVSAIVGAEFLSAKAAALEDKAKTGSMRRVKKDFPEFFVCLKAVVEGIRSALKTTGQTGAAKEYDVPCGR